MSDHRMLEYEEEDDLFGNNEVHSNHAVPLVVNSAAPIASHLPSESTFGVAGISSSRTKHPSGKQKANAQAGPSTGRVYKNVDERLRELQEMRRGGRSDELSHQGGVRSLRTLCIGVVKTNSARIWDIGDLEYPLIKPLLDDMPIEQLQEVETNSPHIKKDTDWLYEIFMLQDYPLFHERCQDRHGVPRTSGWRRMYKKAKEDFAVRQTQAADRVAARYKQLEEEKASKRIVVMDKIMPDKKSPARGSGWGRNRLGGSGTGGLSSSVPKPQNAIAKARLEAQRARVAMTHASGKYIPPAPSKSKNEPNQLFKNPYLPQGFQQAAQQAVQGPGQGQGPRIPPPKLHAPRRPIQRVSSPSSPPSSIPGSYPTSQLNDIRQTLPPHLTHRASQSEETGKTAERSRLEGNQSKYKAVRKKAGEKFVVPELEKEKPKTKAPMVDFFAPSPSPTTASVKKMDKVDLGIKRKRQEEDQVHSVEKQKKQQEDSLTVIPPPAQIVTSPSQAVKPNSTVPRHPQSGQVTTSVSGPGPEVNSVLFRKKKVVRGK
ncbi:uncharacterized protein I303_102982 [Kwoniella dejecticola CBS 10117]|uniref:Elongin-A n=1 Tax=Kwoniella dejecticola CBS 10117 TaxID=1296121 RepID=A0A1A6AA99_9TREE|nr:uncharacterized protein I303_03001 [Kwoniella dejecticola CBS 10117]OBR86979.1 hypothetical protein I303_03001 [Kwoniella dejecticola CBS 10117]